MQKVVCLIACGKSKLPYAAPAKDMYIGELFKKSRAYAERFADEWAILSAKHKLLHPDEVIEPYEQRLPTNREERMYWARTVSDKIAQRWCEKAFYARARADAWGGHPVEWDPTRDGVPRFIVLAGAEYRIAFEGEHVESGYLLDIPVEVPMRGMEIGQQLSWLKAQLG